MISSTHVLVTRVIRKQHLWARLEIAICTAWQTRKPGKVTVDDLFGADVLENNIGGFWLGMHELQRDGSFVLRLSRQGRLEA